MEPTKWRETTCRRLQWLANMHDMMPTHRIGDARRIAIRSTVVAIAIMLIPITLYGQSEDSGLSIITVTAQETRFFEAQPATTLLALRQASVPQEPTYLQPLLVGAGLGFVGMAAGGMTPWLVGNDERN